MRGSTQAHLLRGSDGCFYVTKLVGNPQHDRVLANEMFASRLGRWLGLPIPEVQVIEISDWLIENTPDFRFEACEHKAKYASGRHLGSRYPADPWEDKLFDYMPEELFPKVKNGSDFARMLPLDKWAGNTDGRQAIYRQQARKRTFTAHFIDRTLLQCGKVELPGFGASWGALPEPCLCRRHRMEIV